MRTYDLDDATGPRMNGESEPVQLYDCRDQVQTKPQARRVSYLIRSIKAFQYSVTLVLADAGAGRYRPDKPYAFPNQTVITEAIAELFDKVHTIVIDKCLPKK